MSNQAQNPNVKNCFEIMNKPLVSVVVPAFNEEHHIGRCVASLQKQDFGKPYEVIVVDNNSTDKTTHIARQHGAHVIHERKKGRGAARQAGFANARGEYIFSTDADSVVPTNWVRQLYEALVGGNYVAITGPMEINELSQFTQWFVNTMQPLAVKVTKLFFGYMILSGFNFGIRKDIFDKSGGFNTQLNAMEDVELAKSVEKLGAIAFLDNVIVQVSARRWEKGIIRASLDYIQPFLTYELLRRHTINLDDPR